MESRTYRDGLEDGLREAVALLDDLHTGMAAKLERGSLSKSRWSARKTREGWLARAAALKIARDRLATRLRASERKPVGSDGLATKLKRAGL
jgi:hypothetical protein